MWDRGKGIRLHNRIFCSFIKIAVSRPFIKPDILYFPVSHNLNRNPGFKIGAAPCQLVGKCPIFLNPICDFDSIDIDEFQYFLTAGSGTSRDSRTPAILLILKVYRSGLFHLLLKAGNRLFDLVGSRFVYFFFNSVYGTLNHLFSFECLLFKRCFNLFLGIKRNGFRRLFNRFRRGFSGNLWRFFLRYRRFFGVYSVLFFLNGHFSLRGQCYNADIYNRQGRLSSFRIAGCKDQNRKNNQMKHERSCKIPK